MRFNNGHYIFCYCILEYDDNIISNLNVSYVSFLIVSITTFESFKEIYREHFPIVIKTIIGKNKIRIIDFGSTTYLNLIFLVNR